MTANPFDFRSQPSTRKAARRTTSFSSLAIGWTFFAFSIFTAIGIGFWIYLMRPDTAKRVIQEMIPSEIPASHGTPTAPPALKPAIVYSKLYFDKMYNDLFYDFDIVKNRLAKDEENKGRYKGKGFIFTMQGIFEMQFQTDEHGATIGVVVFALDEVRGRKRTVVVCDLTPDDTNQAKTITDFTVPLKIRGIFDDHIHSDFHGNQKLIFKECHLVNSASGKTPPHPRR